MEERSCRGAEWSREAINLAVAPGPQPAGIARDAIAWSTKTFTTKSRQAVLTKVVFWYEIKNQFYQLNFKVLPVAVISRQEK